jgi:hypothetical protein
MQLGVLTRAGYRALLIRLQGSGLANEPGTKRYTELDAVADIADKVTQALENVTAGLFMTSAVATLDLYERVRYLVQGTSVTDATRQARLIAFHQGASKLVPARLANAFGTYLANLTGQTLGSEAAALRAHASSPLSAFLVGRRETAANTELKRRDLWPILERGLPARATPGPISTADAVWGAALDPASIAVASVVSVPTNKARIAPIEVPPGGSLTREQWIELQSMLCWKSHGFSVNQDKQGRTIFVKITLAPGASFTETSLDYTDRLITVAGCVSEYSVDDPTVRSPAEHVFATTGKTNYGQNLRNYNGTNGQGNGAGVLGIAVGAIGTSLEIDNITNTMAVPLTLNLALMIQVTPTFLRNTTTDTQPWLDADTVLRADLAELYKAQVVSSQNTPGNFAGVSAGALRRVLYTGPLYYQPDYGVPDTAVLDSSEDWRNRWVLVSSCFIASGDAAIPNDAFPVPSCDGMYNADGAPWRIWYTGPGAASPPAALGANEHPVEFPGVGFQQTIFFYVDPAGALCVRMKPVGSTLRRAASCIALVIATERDVSPVSVASVPVHATQVQTVDLEQPQHCGCFAQGQQGGAPRYLLSDAAPKAAPTAPPLGLITEGHSPSRPVSWRVHERLGALDNGTYEVRQKIYGQRKRVVSIVVPAGATVPVDDFNKLAETAPGLNDQVDFRDRYLIVHGRASYSDIRLGAAVPLPDNIALAIGWSIYTGPYELAAHTKAINPTLSIRFEFARAGAGRGLHSRLVLINTDALPVYVNMTVEVSGKLGLCDSRLYGYVP